jgi:hypothetical protein
MARPGNKENKNSASSNQQQQQQQQQQEKRIPAANTNKIPFTILILGVLLITIIINSSQQRKFMSKFESVPSSLSWATTTTTTDDNKAAGAGAGAAAAAENDNSVEQKELLIYSNTIINDVYKYEPPKIDSRGDKNNGCGVSPDFKIWSSIPHVSNRSRYGEDMKIYNLFFKDHIYNNNNNNNITTPTPTLPGGGAASLRRDEVMTYVELGAFDGIRESNSHFFDYCLGWKGLLLEGNPVIYASLLENRPNAHKMNFAPSCHDWNTTVTFFASAFTNAGIKDMAKGYNSNRDKIIEHDVPWYVIAFCYLMFILSYFAATLRYVTLLYVMQCYVYFYFYFNVYVIL